MCRHDGNFFERDYLLKIPPPLVPDLRFNIDLCGTSTTDGLQEEHLFRFNTDQVKQLCIVLRIPSTIRTYARDCYHGIEGLCIVLRHMVFPLRLIDMVHMFGRQYCGLSRIYRDMIMWLHQRWGHLTDFDPQRYIPSCARWTQEVAEVVPHCFDNVWAFLDGTLRFTCYPCPAPYKRPPFVTQYMLQNAQYSGHKHHHGQKQTWDAEVFCIDINTFTHPLTHTRFPSAFRRTAVWCN